MSDRPTTPKKSVRFQVDGEDVPVSPRAEAPMRSSTPTAPKKQVRFAVEEAVVLDSFVLEDTVSLSKKTETLEDVIAPVEPFTPLLTTMTLLDADISLATPFNGAQPGPFDTNVSQNGSAASTDDVNGKPEPTTLSHNTIEAWRDSVPSGSSNTPFTSTVSPAATLPTTPSNSSLSPLSSSRSGTSSPAYEETITGVKVIQLDEGEKDENGEVIEASNEPCERYGGKVVWATKGEWLLTCEGCQEPH